MKYSVQIIKEVQNKRKETKQKVIRVTNAKPRNGIPFESIDEFYQELLKKYKASQIIITAKPMNGGWTTLKSIGHNGDSLKFADDNYFSSAPKEVREKLQGKYYSFDVLINL